jgi:DNA-binding MarR family transcriptional regulator
MADINQPGKYVNMTDLNTPLTRGRKDRESKQGEDRAALPEAKLHAFAELLFFAYRDFTRDPDAILKDFGFGRAHHRVLHFVNRHSGLRVADLLEILNITKQSLSRVLKQLIDQGYIVQQAGALDRRERLLFPTERGRALAERLAAPQMVRLAAALEAAGPGAEATLHHFLETMINAEDRPKVSSIMSASPVEPTDGGKGEGS